MTMNKEYKFTYKGFPVEIRIVDRYPPLCEMCVESRYNRIDKQRELNLKETNQGKGD